MILLQVSTQNLTDVGINVFSEMKFFSTWLLVQSPDNRQMPFLKLPYFSGRSVACIDRQGTGRYSIYLSNYVDRYGRGPCAMVEMDVERSDVTSGRIKIKNVAREVGVERKTGKNFDRNIENVSRIKQEKWQSIKIIS